MNIYKKETQADYFKWKDQAYFQILKQKHVNLPSRIEKYQQRFLTKYQYIQGTNHTQQMHKQLESTALDFDHLLIQLTQDLNFIKLNHISNSIWKLFEALLNIQKVILKKNLTLIEMISQLKKRQQNYSSHKIMCQICDKRLEQVKLKGLLPKTTNATHQIKDQVEKTKQRKKQFQNQIKRLDLDNFYGPDRQILMRKINQLLNQKSISLNRKPAQTQQTLRAILNDYFQKGGVDFTQAQLYGQYEEKLDLVNTFTHVLKQELLEHADQPIRKYIQKLSDYKMRNMLMKKQNSLISIETQTIDSKQLQTIKSLQFKIKSLNIELNGRRMRTQQVQKELMNELMQLGNSQKKIIQLTKKIQNLQKEIKILTISNEQFQNKMEKIVTQKNEQIENLKKSNNQAQFFYKKQITNYQKQIYTLQKKIHHQNQQYQKQFITVATQTIFLKKNQSIQTGQTNSLHFFTAKSGKSIAAKLSQNQKIDQSAQTKEQKKILIEKQYNLEKKLEQKKQTKSKIVRKVDFSKDIEERPFKKLRTSVTMKSQRKIFQKPPTKQKNFKGKNSEPNSIINQGNSTIPLPSIKTQYTQQSFESSQQQNQFDKIVEAQQIQETDRNKNMRITPQKQSRLQNKTQQDQQFQKQKSEIKQLGKSLKKLNKNRVKIHKTQKTKKPSRVRYSQIIAQRLFSSITPFMFNQQSIKEKSERLRLVIQQSYDFLQKTGIISVLEKLGTKNVQGKKVLALQNYFKQNNNRNKKIVNHLNETKQSVQFSVTTKDLELFGGYQNAIKYQNKKGIWASQLSLDCNPQVLQISKLILQFKDIKKKNLVMSYLCYPVQTIVYETIKQADQDILKGALKNLFKFHNNCKPRCSHIKILLNRLGIEF